MKAPDLAPIQHADPRARTRAVAGVIAIAVGGGVLLWWAEDRLASLGPRALGALALAVVAPLPAFAVYFWRLGARIVRARRYPPPGMTVIHDTVILEGDDARRRGRVLQGMAVLMLLALAALAVLAWRLFALLNQPQTRS